MFYTHFAVREDAQVLFGFADQEERRLFRHLISVSGVGPSTARMVLSSMSPEEMIQSVVSGNVMAIQKVKGIGAKSAQRIIIDQYQASTKECLRAHLIRSLWTIKQLRMRYLLC